MSDRTQIRHKTGMSLICRKKSAPRNHSLWLRYAILSAALVLLAGCASETLSIPPVEVPKESSAPPPIPLPEAGTPLAREQQSLLTNFGGVYRSARLESTLNDIAERLRLVSDRPNERYYVSLLNSPTVNAFALPNGAVFLTRGLLALANDTAEIAAVLAHEIAHVTNRHALERNELESRSTLLSRVQAELLKRPDEGQFLKDKSRLDLASFSRQQEIEADEASVRAIARAGFEAHGATRFLIALERSSLLRQKLRGETEKTEIDLLSTHPTTPERIEKALLAARQFGAPGLGEADRTQWLQALNGLVFGDDPAQGLIKGRSFLHPRLKFAFEAPEGMLLENTAHSVLGVSPSAKEAIRFDQGQGSPGQSLGQRLAANPIERIPVTEIKEMTIAGYPAATGLARGMDWVFRVVLIEVDTITYRFIFAAQNFDEAVDASFMASANSFRRLSEAEAKALRPMRIALVPAKAGERAEDIAATRMADIPQAYEQFLVLNGLAEGEAPVPGRVYKIIVD
jgi:predicted Zn-dependent protease